MTGSAWHVLAGNGALAHAIALGDNGQVYFAGSKKNGIDKQDFLLAAFNNDGEDDEDFGVHIDRVPTTSEGELRSLIRLSDGSFIACGNSIGLDQQYGVVIKYKSSGNLETSFNGTGCTMIRHTEGNSPDLVVVQPDGKILVAGNYLNGGVNTGLALARFEADGSTDLTFGTYGYVHADLSERREFSESVYLYPDGKILLGGTYNDEHSGDDYLIVKFNADGTIDEGFGEQGYVTKHIGAYGKHNTLNQITVDGEGRILIAGNANYLGGSYGDATIMRLLPNGDNDPDFGNNGVMQLTLSVVNDTFSDLVISGDGSIFALGYDFAGDARATVAKITTDGVLDESFGTDGLSSIRWNGDMDTQGIDLILQPDGKLVLGCIYKPENTTFEDHTFLYRMLPSGGPDVAFGEDGFAQLLLPSGKDVRIEGMVMDSDGMLYVGGSFVSTIAPTGNHFYLAKFNADGTQSDDFFKSNQFSPTATIDINPTTRNIYAGVTDNSLYGLSIACIGSVGGDDDDDDDDDDNDPDCSSIPQPSITLLADVLYASDGDAFQWYADGELLQGEVNQSLLIDPLVGGVFSVEVAVDGCAKFSDDIHYVVTGRSPESNSIINVSPNPVTDQVCIKSSLDFSQANVRILSIQGTNLRDYQNLSGFTVWLPVHDLPPGMYLLSIQSVHGTEVIKISKSN